MIVAVCVAFVAVYGLSAYLAFTLSWRFVEARDRRERELLAQITNPRAAEAAAFNRAFSAGPDPLTDIDGEDDVRFGRDVTDDFDFIALGEDA